MHGVRRAAEVMHAHPTQRIFCHVPFGNDTMHSYKLLGVVADWFLSPVGDGTFVGWVLPAIWEFKENFNAKGVTLFPSVHHHHLLLGQDLAAKLAHAGVGPNDTMYQAAHKLRAHHNHASLDPDL